MSEGVLTAAPDWSLERAAAEMSRRGVRHLVVFDGGEPVGVLSMRDIVRCWTTRRSDVGNDADCRAEGSLCGRGLIVSTGSAAPRVSWRRGRR